MTRTNQVQVNTAQWQFANNGRTPRGRGRWFFTVGQETFAWTGTFTEARQAAQRRAVEAGVTTVTVQA